MIKKLVCIILAFVVLSTVLPAMPDLAEKVQAAPGDKEAYFLTINNFTADRRGGWAVDSYAWAPPNGVAGLPTQLLARNVANNATPATTDIYIFQPGRYQISAYYKSHSTTTSKRWFQVGIGDTAASLDYTSYKFANFSSAPAGVTGFFEGWDAGYTVDLTAGKKTIGLYSTYNDGSRCGAVMIYKLADGETYDPNNRFAEQLGYQDFVAPTAPGNPSVTGKTASSVTLNWNASTDNSNHIAYDILDVDNSNAVKATVTSSVYELRGLSPETTYRFKIRAMDMYRNYADSASDVSVTTEAAVVEKPSWASGAALSLSQIKPNSVTLTWPSAIAGGAALQSYKVYVNNVETSTVPATAAAEYTKVIANLLPETAYTFKVTAVDSLGQSSASYTGTDQKQLTALASTASRKQAFFLTFNNFAAANYGGWSKDTNTWTPQPYAGLPLYMLVRGNSANAAPATSEIYISEPGKYQISAYYKSHATNTSSRIFKIGVGDGVGSVNYTDYRFANLSSAPAGVTAFFEGWDTGYTVDLTAGKKVIAVDAANNCGARCAAIVIYKLDSEETYDPNGKFEEQLAYQDFVPPQSFTAPPEAVLVNETAVRLDWQAAIDSGTKVQYYDIYKNGVLADRIPGAQNTYTFANLDELEHYNFKIIAGDAYVNTTGDENASTEITCGAFTVDNPENNFIFTDTAGNKLSASPSAGQQVKAKAVLKKQMAGPQTGELMIGIYNRNNILVDFQTVPFTVTTGTGTIETLPVTMPATGSGYRVKAFLWKSLDGLQPLYKNKIEL